MFLGIPWFVWLALVIYGGMYAIVYGHPSFHQFLADFEKFRAEMGQADRSEPKDQPKEPTES